MISIKDLCISYNSNQLVIDQLELSLKTQTIHGLVGLNGSGKTTLLSALHGLIKPKAGIISYKEEPLTKKDIAFLPAENYFYPNITAREYLNLFPNVKFNIDEWNDLFKLPLDQIIDGYSTGMKKKLAILGILKQDRSIVILDEPFNGLDLETCRTMRSILLTLKTKQKTILVTSHILDSLMDLCDEIHYLEEGRIKNSIHKEHFDSFKTEIYSALIEKTEHKIKNLLKT